MEKTLFQALAGLALFASGALAAGSYTENFESYGTLNYSGNMASLNNGAVLYANSNNVSNIFQYGSSWKALRMAQDGAGNTTATYVVGTVENPATRVNSFTASFSLQFKQDALPGADNFTFDFGKLTGTTFPRSTESGLWTSSQPGSMLSVVWDFYDNLGGDYVGTGGNGGIQLFKNGALVSGSNVNNPATIFGSLTNTFTRFNVRYNEEVNGGTLQLNTGGTVGADNLITGGTDLFTISNLGVNFQAGDQFAFSSWTGGANIDIFVDDVSIKTVPEPSALSLLAVGLGGLVLLRQSRKKD